MNINEIFPSRWLKGADCAEPKTLTIASVTTEQLGQSEETKPVIRWAEDAKPLILNRTNAKTIAAFYGNETEQWVGNKITLVGQYIDAFGESVFAVRVRREVTQDMHADPLGFEQCR